MYIGKQNKNRFLAQYDLVGKNRKPTYRIMLPGCYNELEEYRERVIASSGLASIRQLSVQERLVLSTWGCSATTAVHEVRHRVQDEFNDIHLFTPAYANQGETEDIRNACAYVKMVDAQTRLRMKKAGHKPAFIRERTSPIEFDAQVIETLAELKLDKVKSVHEFTDLVTMSA